jgi:hypothetical protein
MYCKLVDNSIGEQVVLMMVVIRATTSGLSTVIYRFWILDSTPGTDLFYLPLLLQAPRQRVIPDGIITNIPMKPSISNTVEAHIRILPKQKANRSHIFPTQSY